MEKNQRKKAAHANESINKTGKHLFIATLQHILQHKIDQAASFIRISVVSMPKKELKLLAAYINDFVLGDECENFPSWFKMTLDVIETKIDKLTPNKPEKKLPKYRINF